MDVNNDDEKIKRDNVKIMQMIKKLIISIMKMTLIMMIILT